MSESCITVSLNNLRNGNVPFSTLEAAFGPESLGIMIVKDLEPEFVGLRHRLLSYSSYLANLPASHLEKLENPSAKYLTGWSLGKETLRDGQIDTLKGSYYANCAFYVNPKLTSAKPIPEFSVETFPEYLSPNIWPPSSVLPGFCETFQDLCRIIIDTAVLVAKACDLYAEREIEGYTAGYLQRVVQTSTTTKARLLHYFPTISSPGSPKSPSISRVDDNWCSTHLDHGCLTGLTSGMFIDEILSSPEIPVGCVSRPRYLSPLAELPSSPDPEAGLYIQSRNGRMIQVNIPRDCLAFQTGEALEIITEGRFKAVPHFVKGIRPGFSNGNVARNTLAVFTQPDLGELVDVKRGLTFGEFARGVVERNTMG